MGKIQHRLFQLDALFQRGRTWSAEELATELGTSGRTINRYVRRLREDFGAPVASSVAGYRYERPFTLKPLELDEKDLFALYSARAVLEQYRGSFLTRQIDERIEELVAGLVDRLPREGLDLSEYVSFRISGTPATELDQLMELLEAALLRRRLDLHYRTAGSAEPRKRRVDPYALTNRDGVWYLLGHDHLRGKVVPFNVSRIARFRRTDDTFERPEDFDPQEHFRDAFGVMRGDRPAQTVVVRFSPARAHIVREREFHPTQTLTEREDGGVDYRVEINEPTEILPFVLGFGSEAEILEPGWLREKMRDEAGALADRYARRVSEHEDPQRTPGEA